MVKYKIYSVFVDLNTYEDSTEIPIVHKRIETVSRENAIKLALCSLSVSALKGTKVKATATLLSNWKTQNVQCN